MLSKSSQLNERQKFQMNALAERFKKINLATATVEGLFSIFA